MKKIIIAVIGLLLIPAMVQASFSPAPYADRKVERLLESGVKTVVADTYFGVGSELIGIEANMGLLERPTITRVANGDSAYITDVSGLFYSDTNFTRFARKYNIKSGTVPVYADAVTYVYATLINGQGEYRSTTDRDVIEFSQNIPVARIAREDGVLSVTQGGIQGRGLIEKLLKRSYRINPFAIEDGLVLSDAGTQAYEITSGNVWYGSNRITTANVESVSDSSWFYYRDGDTWIAELSDVYNNQYYTDGTTRLNLSPNRYAISWVYVCVNDVAEVAGETNIPRAYILFGRENYSSLAAARAELPPADVPPPVTNNGVLAGRIIVVRDSTDPEVVEQSIAGGVAGGQTTNHNNLSGLQGGADDEYYHLSAGEYDNIVLDGGSPTFHFIEADTGMFGAATVEAEPVADTDVANKAYVDAHAGNGNGSYDTYVIDVIIGPDESDTITHNLNTVVPTVITYDDITLPYAIVDVPTMVIDENNIRLDVSGDTFSGRVKVTK